MPFQLVLKKIGSIGFLYSPELFNREKVLVVFTLRQGGVSLTPYNLLNLGFHVGDHHQNVLKNRKLIMSCFNLDINQMTTAEQIHGNRSVLVKEELIGRGAQSYEDSISGTDALICGLNNVPLALFFADCVPLVIVDPVTRCIAVIHAGWRGIMDNIIPRTLSKFGKCFDVKIPQLIAYIGPSIGRCCYEVGQPLIERFKAKFNMTIEGSKIDLPRLVKTELRREGVLGERIISADLCTSCRSDMFFSFRRENETGRQAALVALLDEDHELPAFD